MCLNTVIFLFAILRGVDLLLAPSYVSGWLWMDVNNYTSTDVTLNHNFGVRPVKADVQVKSPNTGFIYPGVRSAHAQNDDSKRGGVICLYGINTVRLLGATNENAPAANRAYIIYTGTTTWTSENWEALEAAWVRVRLWNPADLPAPSYTISTDFAAEGPMFGRPNYLELAHNLGSLPILTVVQYCSTDSASYLSTVVAEAQGTSAIQVNGHDYNLKESSLVFGVSSSHIRLWAFNDLSGRVYGVFSFCRGWGYYTATSSDCFYRQAYVNISFWTQIEDDVLNTQQVTHTLVDSASHEYSTTTFDAALGLVTVTSSPISGVNSGFEFDGTGAAMSDGIENSAGLIYAYNEDGRVRLWHPLSPYCIVQVGPIFGEDTNNQCAAEVRVTINVWGTGCPWIEVDNAVATGTVESITYTCDVGSDHVSGDLERSCQDDSTWNGTLPECRIACPWTEVDNAVATGTVYTSVTYVCNVGSIHISGHLERSCQADSTWNGTLPVCQAVCPWIEVENAVATGTVDSSVTYVCNDRSIHISGDLERSCQGNSTWNGTLPVCQLCAPLETGPYVTLDTHLLATQYIANFSCVDGFELLSGNLTRYCGLPNATWSGTAPVCGVATTASSSTTTTIVTTTTTTSTVAPPTTTSTTTPATTTVPSIVEVCYNITNVIYNTTTLLEQTEQIIANLTIDVKSTSKFERSKTSAKDSRASSMYVGLVGYLIFGFIGAIIVIPDILGGLRYLWCRSDKYDVNE